MKQIEKNSLIVIFFVAVFMIFFGLGGVPLLDPDEPVYAETAREMLRSGDFLSPQIFGAYWFDKPPLYYWLVAAAQFVFGDNEFAARFPAAIMAVGTVIMVYISAAKQFGERAGFWGAVVLTTCLQMFYMGKAAVTDTTLLFFLTGALLSFSHRKYWIMYIFMGFGILTKGPIGIVFPGAIIFLYLLFMGRLHEILQMHVVRGVLLCLLIAAPWYVAMYSVHGMEFVETFLGFHNITRFTTAEHADRVTFWYYFPVVLLGLFPWTGILFQSVKASVYDSRIDDMERLVFMHVWWLFVFVFFTVCRTKLVSYILPLFPALAMIMGWYIARLDLKAHHNSKYYGWMAGSALLFILLGAGWIFGASQLPEAAFGMTVLGALTLLLGGAAVFSLWYYRDVNLAAWLHALVGAVTMCVVFAFLLPIVSDRFSVKSMSGVYKESCDETLPIYVDKFLRPGFMFYAGKAGTELLPNTDSFSAALADGKAKYILVRGLEYRRQLKKQPLPPNVMTVKEMSDIYLLEQK